MTWIEHLVPGHRDATMVNWGMASDRLGTSCVVSAVGNVDG